jgi:hypothetical protein
VSDESKIRDAADAIKGIVEAVPVYQDIAQPAAKEIGTALQTVAKTIHIALAPLSAMVWGYDRIKDYLEQALTDKLKGVPPEKIITPNPAVAGPAIEALRFTAHEPSLRELYANLLATSMDSETAQYSHPAFIEIIRQMTADEGRIIALLALENSYNMKTWVADTKDDRRIILISKNIALSEKASCSFGDLIPIYLVNLRRLGLIEIQPEVIRAYLPHQDEPYFFCVGGRRESENMISDSEVFKTIEHLFPDKGELKKDEIAYLMINIEPIILTHLGQQFCSACVLPKNLAS